MPKIDMKILVPVVLLLTVIGVIVVGKEALGLLLGLLFGKKGETRKADEYAIKADAASQKAGESVASAQKHVDEADEHGADVDEDPTIRKEKQPDDAFIDKLTRRQ